MIMNPEVKAKWVEALRSGRYQQGRGRLHSDGIASAYNDVYCCLGVLCEVVGVARERNPSGIYSYGGETNFPNDYELAAVGLTSDDARHLSRMNDGSGHDGEDSITFEQIADYIEEKH